jgi:acylphosphatase
MRRVRAIVSGRVQGVSFRAATAEQATQLGVVGWIKNRSDGCVEIEAEGTPEQVAALLAWCEQGPPHARVARFTVEELSPAASHVRERQFTITH